MPTSVDGRRKADKKFGYIHPCVTFPLSDLTMVFPKQKDIKKQPMFTCLQTKEYCY